MVTLIKQYEIPTETLAVFQSTMITRKERISILVKWFMKNWWRWTSDDMLPDPPKPSTITDFAAGLTSALSEYEVTIKRQRVWTWMSQRNLPHSDNFYVMAKVATGWQLEFAQLLLNILASEEPVQPQS